MPRTKIKTIDECRLILNDVVRLIVPDAASMGKKIAYLNSIMNVTAENFSFSEDDKNRSSRNFLMCETSDICGTDSAVIRKRDAMYSLFKERLPDVELSGIFRTDAHIPMTDELVTVYMKEKSNYEHGLAAFLDDMLQNNRKLFPRWMIFISSFPLTEPNDTYNYIHRITQRINESFHPSAAPDLHSAKDRFIARNLEVPCRLLEVNIGANHGLRWLDKEKSLPQLKRIIEKADHVNIMITEHETAESFTQLIRDPKGIYESQYASSILKWTDRCLAFGDKVSFKISDIPVLRQYLEFRFEDDSLSALFVGSYTYGGMPFAECHFMALRKGEAYFDLYRHEFRYLFERETPALPVPRVNEPVAESTAELISKINSLSDIDRTMLIHIINRMKNKAENNG